MEGEGRGARVTALQNSCRAPTTLTDDFSTQRQIQGETVIPKELCDEKVSPLGLLRVIRLILHTPCRRFLSHEQLRAGGQDCGIAEELVKAVKSLCLETRHHRHSAPHLSTCHHWLSSHRLTSLVQKCVKVPSSASWIGWIIGNHQWGPWTPQT